MAGDVIAISDLSVRHAAGKPRLGQRAQIRPCGHTVGAGELREMLGREIKTHLATLGDANRIFHRTGVTGEEHTHLLGALVVKLVGGEPCASPLSHHIAGANTSKHLLGVCVLATQVMAVIGGDKGEPRLAGQAQKRGQDLPLLGQIVILHLDKEAILPKHLGKLQRAQARAIVVPGKKLARNITRKTA